MWGYESQLFLPLMNGQTQEKKKKTNNRLPTKSVELGQIGNTI